MSHVITTLYQHRPVNRTRVFRRPKSKMKTTTILAVLGLLGANMHGTTATPMVKVPRTGQPKSWEFFLFQNDQCTGPQDNFRGNGSSPCRNDVIDHNAQGLIKGNISPSCVVTLFQGQNCTLSIQNITSHTQDICQRLPTPISSFDVHCFRPHFMFMP